MEEERKSTEREREKQDDTHEHKTVDVMATRRETDSDQYFI
jgi:predicted RNA-binding protein